MPALLNRIRFVIFKPPQAEHLQEADLLSLLFCEELQTERAGGRLTSAHLQRVLASHPTMSVLNIKD